MSSASRTESYLDFTHKASESGKTTVTTVLSRRHGDKLGTIRWYGSWRQYAFYPEPGTIWNPDCLDEIKAQIRTLMAERNTRAER